MRPTRINRSKQRRWRKAKRAALTSIGQSPKTKNPPRVVGDLLMRTVSTFSTNTLYAQLLWQVPQITDGANQATHQQGRLRGYINTLGIKLRLNFKNIVIGNLGAAGETPLFVNMAIISDDTPADFNSDGTGTYGTGDLMGQNFFRNIAGADRGTPFKQPQLSGIERHTLPINKDSWQILYHRRFTLGVKSTGNTFMSGELKNYKTMSRWMPIKRRLTFEGTEANTCQNKIWLVWWCTAYDYPGDAVQADAVSALQMQGNVYSYFY